jgi:hypothetical protein
VLFDAFWAPKRLKRKSGSISDIGVRWFQPEKDTAMSWGLHKFLSWC